MVYRHTCRDLEDETRLAAILERTKKVVSQ
jgi:hypothetical protein